MVQESEIFEYLETGQHHIATPHKQGFQNLRILLGKKSEKNPKIPWDMSKSNHWQISFWSLDNIIPIVLIPWLISSSSWLYSCQLRVYIAKGTTDPRVEFSWPKLKQVQTKILMKLNLQNLDQTSTSKSQSDISISTKLKIQNSKYWQSVHIAYFELNRKLTQFSPNILLYCPCCSTCRDFDSLYQL